MVFIKTVENAKAKMLFIMGASTHTKCHFDLDMDEPSFSDILNDYGIDTYAFDTVGIAGSSREGIIGNAHNENVQIGLDLINKYNIDYVFAYSYGTQVLADMLEYLPSNVKKVFMLDAFPDISSKNVLPPILVDGGDKKLVTPNDIADRWVGHYNCKVKPEILELALKSFSGPEGIAIPTYPDKSLNPKLFFEKVKNEKREVRFYFSGSSKQRMRELFKNHLYLPDYTHIVLLEEGRYTIAEDVVIRVNG